MLGIIGAMSEEVANLKAEMEDVLVCSAAGWIFIRERCVAKRWW